MSEKPWVKTYAGGKPNYCTPEEIFILDRGCYERGCVAYDERDGDGVNILAERVDETAKGEHEPLCYLRDDIDRPFGGFEDCDKDDPGAFPVYTAPPKREWVGLTDDEIQAERHKLDPTAGWTYDHFARAIEAKLKEKNVPQP